MKLLIFAILAILSSPIPNYAEEPIAIPGVALRPKKKIDALLGVGKCEPTKGGKKCSYRDGKVEVVFKDGTAKTITLNDLAGVPFNDQVLPRFGLPNAAPIHRSADSIRWEGVAGIKQVELFSSGKMAWYLYVVAQ